jgi:hypothetical protein
MMADLAALHCKNFESIERDYFKLAKVNVTPTWEAASTSTIVPETISQSRFGLAPDLFRDRPSPIN